MSRRGKALKEAGHTKVGAGPLHMHLVGSKTIQGTKVVIHIDTTRLSVSYGLELDTSKSVTLLCSREAWWATSGVFRANFAPPRVPSTKVSPS